MTSDQRFLPRMHLRQSRDFAQIYASGLRVGDDHLLVFAVRNLLGYSRLGLSVSRKHGPAVRRNLKRRRLKESFRLTLQQLPLGLDLVLVPRNRTDSTLANYTNSLRQLAQRLDRRLLRQCQNRGVRAVDSISDTEPAP